MATPLAPLFLVPSSGSGIIASAENSFVWQGDSTQAGYYLEWALNETGSTLNNTGWITDSLGSHTFLASSFVDTKIYKWRVKIRNSAGIESVYSEWAVFRVGSAPGVTITFPAADLDVLSAAPTYTHQYNNPGGFYQVAYQYKLFTGTTWDDFDALTAAEQEAMTWDELEAYSTGVLLWDSGRVESTATSVEQPSDKLLVLQYWYKVQVTIWDNAGNEVTSSIRTYGLLVESVPQIPTISVVADSTNGKNTVTITNPTPAVGQVAADYNKLYRRKLDDTWELVHDNIAIAGGTGTGYDTTCRSAKEEEYAVSAVSADGIESSKSESDFATCYLSSYWFTNLTTLATLQLKSDPKWGQMQSEREREEVCGMDESYPAVMYGSRRFYRGSFQALVFEPDSITWSAYTKQIRDVLDADTPALILMRSPYGDLFTLDVYDFRISQNDRIQQTRRISFNFVEVEETVPAGTYTYDTVTSPPEGYWLIDTDTGKGFRIYLEPQWGDLSSERDRAETIGLGGEMPEASYGNKKAIRGGFSGLILKPTDGTTLAEKVMELRELVDGKTKKPVWLRMTSGDLFYVDVYGFTFELYDRLDQARKISFEFIEIKNTNIINH